MSVAASRLSRKPSQKSRHAQPQQRIVFPIVYYVLIAVVILSAALIRWRLRDMPLERDEGEYAYAGQLMLQGIPPYQLAYNMKLPGTYAAYAAILALFGETPAAVHIGLLLVNAATTFLVFLLGARLFGGLAGLVAGASYALLSTSPVVLGLAGHATHFVVLPAVGGVLLLLRALQSKRGWQFFASGLLAGVAFVMKQPGIFFVLFSAIYLLQSEIFHRTDSRNHNENDPPAIDYGALGRRLGVFLTGAALPFGLTCLWLLRAGVFPAFWFWTFSYARQYGTRLSPADGVGTLEKALGQVAGGAALVWILALIGVTALVWSRKGRSHAWFVSGFFLFSFLAVCPGFYFRQHYFILMLPAVALLVGLAVSAAEESLKPYGLLRLLPVFVFLAAGIYTLAHQSEILFELDPIAACRKIYGRNPFPEAIKIADYIRSHSAENARIAVVGSEPEIYFYAHRHSATGYIYTYALMEPQKYSATMEQEMVKEIEAARPEFLVLVDVPFSWLAQRDSSMEIFEWAAKYSSEYQRVGVIEIGKPTQYRWGEEARDYHSPSRYKLTVFQRSTP
jgi:hypothetical protein